MKLSPSIEALIEGLRHLPGVGPKSAQRMTLHLLERDREGAQEIADAISDALAKVKNCSRCRNFTELDVCEICADVKTRSRHPLRSGGARGCDGYRAERQF